MLYLHNYDTVWYTNVKYHSHYTGFDQYNTNVDWDVDLEFLKVEFQAHILFILKTHWKPRVVIMWMCNLAGCVS